MDYFSHFSVSLSWLEYPDLVGRVLSEVETLLVGALYMTRTLAFEAASGMRDSAYN